MRIVVAALAAAAVAGLAFPADAAPSGKKKSRSMANKESSQPQGRRTRDRAPQFGYDATPEHYRTGSNDWWRAMEREGRGGFGDTQ